MMKIGSHVGMSGKEMFLGSVKEALSYGADTLMVYTGAPQNTRRKAIEELRVEEGWELMKANGMDEIVIHAPYIINLANTVKPETYELAVEFLAKEIDRTAAMGSKVLILHPGAHVGAGEEAGIKRIIEGLNTVLTADTPVNIALETMAGKGSEIGGRFEELKAIIDGVREKDKIGVCMDTCHVSDAGYDIVNDLEGVLKEFDDIVGLERLHALHINDSMNPLGAHKDRHARIGEGTIGKEGMVKILCHPALQGLPCILETPQKDLQGYGAEIRMLREAIWERDSEKEEDR